MHAFFFDLLGWLPLSLQLVCSGVIVIFLIVTVLRLVAFILDVIPFV